MFSVNLLIYMSQHFSIKIHYNLRLHIMFKYKFLYICIRKNTSVTDNLFYNVLPKWPFSINLVSSYEKQYHKHTQDILFINKHAQQLRMF